MKSSLLFVFAWLCYGLNFAQDTLFLPVQYEGKWHFIDTFGVIQQQKPVYDNLIVHHMTFSNYYAFQQNGKYGVTDIFLHPLLEPIYDTVISKGNTLLAKKGKQWISTVFNYNPGKEDHVFDILDFEADSVFLDGNYTYFYLNNKCGLILGTTLVAKAKYDRISPLSSTYTYYDHNYYLSYANNLFGLIDKLGKEVLAPKYEEIQVFDYNYFRIKQGHWKYYNIALNAIIDPKGFDIVFYKDKSWKIYDAPDGSCAFFRNGKRFDAGYDDYFPQENDEEIAVRKNGKIGLIDANGNILIEPKFDQLESVREGFYRYFTGDLCGLVSSKGKILTEALYHNIVLTNYWGGTRMIVIKDKKTGVINDNGKQIVALQYDFIVDNSFYLRLQNKNLFGAADLDGKIIVPLEYDEIDFSKQTSIDESGAEIIQTILVCRKNSEFFIYNKNGLLSKSPGTHYQMANNTIKMYGSDFIDVYALAPDGTEESYQRYTSTPSMIIEDQKMHYDDALSGHPYSSVKANQQTGKSGLRHYTKAGWGVEADFRRIRIDHYNSFNLGEVTIPKTTWELAETVKLSSESGDRILSLSDATKSSDIILNSELLDRSFRGISSVDEMKWGLDGEMQWITPNGNFPDSKKAKACYIENVGLYYRRVLYDAELSICPIEQADYSLLEYWKYLNKHNNLWFDDPKSTLLFMNPKLGVKFTGGYWLVTRDNVPTENEKHIKAFGPSTPFADFSLAEDQNSHLFFLKEKNQYYGRFEDLRNDSTKLTGVTNLIGAKGDLIYYEKNDPKAGIIDASKPGFYFQPNATDLYFSDGMIIFQKQGLQGLKNNSGEVLIPAQFEQITFLGSSRLAIKTAEGWGLCYLDGKFINTEVYDTISPFSNGLALCKKENSGMIMNTDGEQLRTLNANTLLLNKKGLFLEQGQSKKYFSTAKGKIVDSLANSESLINECWISGKNKKGLWYSRSIGGKNLSWKSNKAPKQWGNLLINQEGKQLQFLDSTAKIITVVKGDKITLNGEGFIRVKTSKKYNIYNRNGVLIHTIGNAKDVVHYDNFLFFQLADTAYFVDQEGNKLKVDKQFKPEQKLPLSLQEGRFGEVKSVGNYYMVLKNGLWGITDREGTLLLPCSYEFMEHLSGSYFRVPNQKQLYVTHSNLKPILEQPFEEFFSVGQQVLRVKSGDSYGYVNLNGLWIWKIQ